QVTESHEQQTATSEILQVISTSPTAVNPSLEAVVEAATRLCAATDAVIFRVDGDTLRLAAHHGPIAPGPLGESAIPVPMTMTTVAGRAVLEHRPAHVKDLQAAGEEYPDGHAAALRFGYRTTLAVPLLREAAAIGVILIRRTEVRPFSDQQIKLLETFARQAVIAIENVRLFTELQARNRDLTATG